MLDRCVDPAGTRRRVFWTTQPDACGSSQSCDAVCGIPGLKFRTDLCVSQVCTCCTPPEYNPDCLAAYYAANPTVGRSFVTNDWVRSLVLNILMTDGRLPDAACGYKPGAQGGHWSESYRSDGLPIGTLMRNIGRQPSIRDAISLIKAYVMSSLAKLVTLKVAFSVDVITEYLGGNRLRLGIEVVGPSGTIGKVDLIGSRLENEWVWA